jgi:hypothetical protein
MMLTRRPGLSAVYLVLALTALVHVQACRDHHPTDDEAASAREECDRLATEIKASDKAVLSMKVRGGKQVFTFVGADAARIIACFQTGDMTPVSNRVKRMAYGDLEFSSGGTAIVRLGYFKDSVYSFRDTYFQLRDDPLIEYGKRLKAGEFDWQEEDPKRP